MKERQRWKSEEDALLLSYVTQYGPREWGLVSQRMNAPFFRRDAKSCLERWKNYLRPGIKKGSLTEQEQSLVIRLQAKHGNKWKKIAAEVPGRTAKRLGKWWEVFKERKQREEERQTSAVAVAVVAPIHHQDGKYDQLLESFAEKLAKQQHHHHTSNPPPPPPLIMNTPPLIPPWLQSNSNNNNIVPPCSMMSHPSPSVTLTLSSPTTTASPPAQGVVTTAYSSWLQNPGPVVVTETTSTPINHHHPLVDNSVLLLSDLRDCCRELEEGHQAWATHKKESTWMLRRVELQLESEKARKKKEKMDEIDAKIRALREEEKAGLDRIDAEYREHLMGLRREAEAKEQKLVDHWSANNLLLAKFLDQMGGGGGCHHRQQ